MAPAASLRGLAIFLERCEASGTLSLTMLWADLTTSFSAVTIKSCVPSQQCFRWNCACGRQVRTIAARSRLGWGDVFFCFFFRWVGGDPDVWTHRRQTADLNRCKRLMSRVILEFLFVLVHAIFAPFPAPRLQPRAQQATAPIIGAIVYLPANEEIASQGAFAGKPHNDVCPSI